MKEKTYFAKNKREILALEKAYNKAHKKHLQPILKKLEKFNGKDFIIPFGRFAGRLGEIGGIQMDRRIMARDYHVVALVKPYNLRKVRSGETLNDPTDARTFWSLVSRR